MTQQFTASEVRDAITWKYGDKLTRISAMLNAFADLLEAQGKAVPVATCGYSSTVEHRASNANVVGSNPIARSNSDAERLAEALRTIQHSMQQAQIYGNDSRREIKLSASVCEQALAAHSARTPWTEGEKAHFKAAAELVAQREAAQAQPPAASVPDAETLRLHLGELTPDEVCVAKAAYRLALAAQAQPPAARATDAAFPSHRACVPYENHPGKRIVGFVIDESHPWWGKCGLTEPLSALEAALAAQENPNG